MTAADLTTVGVGDLDDLAVATDLARAAGSDIAVTSQLSDWEPSDVWAPDKTDQGVPLPYVTGGGGDGFGDGNGAYGNCHGDGYYGYGDMGGDDVSAFWRDNGDGGD
jgi:hypothetical protein